MVLQRLADRRYFFIGYRPSMYDALTFHDNTLDYKILDISHEK